MLEDFDNEAEVKTLLDSLDKECLKLAEGDKETLKKLRVLVMHFCALIDGIYITPEDGGYVLIPNKLDPNAVLEACAMAALHEYWRDYLTK